MNTLEQLEDEVYKQDIVLQKADLPETVSGIYYNDGINQPLIALNKSLTVQAQQTCVVAEELGHHYTSCGDLLTDPDIDNTIIRQQETRAKRWAVKKLVTIKSIIAAFESGCSNSCEMAEHLDVTEEFLRDAFKKYGEMYGKYKVKGKYVIYFDPPGILKKL